MNPKTYPIYYIFQAIAPDNNSFLFCAESIEQAKKEMEKMSFKKEERIIEYLKRYSYKDFELHTVMTIKNNSMEGIKKELNRRVEDYISQFGKDKILNDKKNYEVQKRKKVKEVHIRVKQPSRKGLSSLYYEFSYCRPAFRYFPFKKIEVPFQYWNLETESIDLSKIDKSETFKYQSLQTSINLYKNYIEKMYEEYTTKHNREPDREMLKKLVDNHYKNKFKDFITPEKIIIEAEKSQTGEDKVNILLEFQEFIKINPDNVEPSTLNHYNQTFKYLNKFYQKYNYSQNLEKFNSKMWDTFKKFLIEDNVNFTDITANVYLSCLKKFLNYQEINFNTKKMKLYKLKTNEKEFLTSTEIEQFRNCTLPSQEQLVLCGYYPEKITMFDLFNMEKMTYEDRYVFLIEKGIDIEGNLSRKHLSYGKNKGKKHYIDKLLEMTPDNKKPSKVYQLAKDIAVLVSEIGLRYSDVMSLSKDNVQELDFDGRKIKCLVVNTEKKDINVTLPLSSIALEILEKYHYKMPLLRLKELNEYLKNLLKYNNMLMEKRQILKYRLQQKTSKFEHRYHLVSIHSFRHSAASLLYSQGVDIKSIQYFLAHRTAKTTEVYLHKKEDDILKTLIKAKIN